MTLESAMKILDAYRFGECENEELQEQVRILYPPMRNLINKCFEEGILSED